MLTDDEVRALIRARAQRWVERKLRNRVRYERRMRRIDQRWGSIRNAWNALSELSAAKDFARSFWGKPLTL
jgi:hypothetical protein